MKKYAIAALAALGLVSLPVQAAEDSGFYVGAGLGISSVETDAIEIFEDVEYDFDDSGTAWKIFGGWRLNKYVSFELDYVDLGTVEDDFTLELDNEIPAPSPDSGPTELYVKTEIGVTAWVPYVVLTYPIGMFEVSGKLGYAFWDADFDVYATDGFDSFSEGDSDSDEDFAWGVGAGVTLLDNLNVKVEYEAIEVSDADVSVWWLTGAWRF